MTNKKIQPTPDEILGRRQVAAAAAPVPSRSAVLTRKIMAELQQQGGKAAKGKTSEQIAEAIGEADDVAAVRYLTSTMAMMGRLKVEMPKTADGRRRFTIAE